MGVEEYLTLGTTFSHQQTYVPLYSRFGVSLDIERRVTYHPVTDNNARQKSETTTKARKYPCHHIKEQSIRRLIKRKGKFSHYIKRANCPSYKLQVRAKISWSQPQKEQNNPGHGTKM